MNINLDDFLLESCIDVLCDKYHCGICNNHIVEPKNSVYICDNCKNLNIQDRMVIIFEVANRLDYSYKDTLYSI